jgi:hypothetical protein
MPDKPKLYEIFLRALTEAARSLDRVAEPETLTAGAGRWRVTVSVVQGAKAEASPAAAKPLRGMKADILQAMGADVLAPREIAAKAGNSLNSYFRKTLREMRREGLIRAVGGGYERTLETG